MRQFSILVVFALAFGGAIVFYEQEARKVKGVLSQITELQAQVGDMQAEINRLNGELEAVKLAERRRPNLGQIANRVLREDGRPQVRQRAPEESGRSRELVASDVTTAPPAIRSRGEAPEDDEWNRPTVDAEDSTLEADPYQ